MRPIYWIIIGISVPAALFGIFVLSIAVNTTQLNENTDTWMVEIESHLDLTEMGLAELINNDENSWDPTKHGEEKILVYKIEYLDDFVRTLPSDIHGQLEERNLLDNRFVLYVDKNSGFSEDEIQDILIKIDGIKDAQLVFDWILGKD